MPSPSEPLQNVLLTTTVVEALTLASTRRGQRPLDTLDILVAVLDVDVGTGWEAVQTSASYVSEEDVGRFADPEPDPRGTWQRVPLTRTATTALHRAARTATDYRLLPMPTGVLVLGLLSEERSGASLALLEETSLSHADLLEAVQDEVLDVTLEGLDLRAPGETAPRSGRFERFAELTGGAAGPRPRHDDVPSIPMAEGALTRQALAGAQRIDRSSDPGSLALLAAAVELARDADLVDLLSSMLLDPVALLEAGRRRNDLEDMPATDVLQRALERYGEDPDVAALVVTIAAEASPRVAATLEARGIAPAEVAGQMARWRLDRDDVSLATSRVIAVTYVALLVSVATSVLIVLDVIADGGWWKLLLLLPAWWGYPKEGPVYGVGFGALLALLVSPLIGVVQLVGVATEVAQAAVERDALWERSGVRMSLRQQRHVATRQLNAHARRMRTIRQAATVAFFTEPTLQDSGEG